MNRAGMKGTITVSFLWSFLPTLTLERGRVLFNINTIPPLMNVTKRLRIRNLTRFELAFG